MNSTIFIRPLTLSDAKTSYKWRNNKVIWKFTTFKASGKITEAIETEWLQKVLNNENDHRYAICLKETEQYIGNVQLINVKNRRGEFHVFIGDTKFWGKGIGKEATQLMLYYAFNILELSEITLSFFKGNTAAEVLYKELGFQVTKNNENQIYMILPYKRYKKLLNIDKAMALPNSKKVLLAD